MVYSFLWKRLFKSQSWARRMVLLKNYGVFRSSIHWLKLRIIFHHSIAANWSIKCGVFAFPPGRAVNTSTPLSVTTMVCSNWNANSVHENFNSSRILDNLLIWSYGIFRSLLELGRHYQYTVVLISLVTMPTLCSKSAIFREAWHIVNLQPCPWPLEVLIPHIRAFKWCI